MNAAGKTLYRRVETTTSVMPQERYEALLLDRAAPAGPAPAGTPATMPAVR